MFRLVGHPCLVSSTINVFGSSFSTKEASKWQPVKILVQQESSHLKFYTGKILQRRFVLNFFVYKITVILNIFKTYLNNFQFKGKL